jgi:hypothetical protein
MVYTTLHWCYIATEGKYCVVISMFVDQILVHLLLVLVHKSKTLLHHVKPMILFMLFPHLFVVSNTPDTFGVETVEPSKGKIAHAHSLWLWFS